MIAFLMVGSFNLFKMTYKPKEKNIEKLKLFLKNKKRKNGK
tara:strand:+ start:84 stop:206 length:123 start_codon:yes stop_codon:yes gene_type:complete